MKIMDKLRTLDKHPTWGSVIQFVKFGIVGVSNTMISLGVYWLCFYLLHMHYQLSNLIAFIVSVTNAYYWNSKYVFKSGVKRTSREHIKAYKPCNCYCYRALV